MGLIVVIAGLAWLAWLPATPGYDASYALAWAQDALAGRDPDLGVVGTPTPHPLTLAVAFVAAPLGAGGETLTLALAWLAFAGLGWAVFRLGQELGGTAVGVLAAAIVLASSRLATFSATGTGDVAAAAFVLAAAVLEVRRPRAGWPVLVLLGLAGLLRPEAWLFAVAYWCWLAPARGPSARAGLAVLALAAPLLWMATDVALTGEPLYSAGSTAGLADEYGIPHTLDAVPERLPAGTGGLVGAWIAAPLLIGAVAGVALGWRRALAVPLALVGLSALAFVVLAIAGQPLLMRYLIVAAAALAVLGAHGALGWRTAGATGGGRRRAAGIAVLVALAALAIPQAVKWLDVRAESREAARIVASIKALARDPAARAVMRQCPPTGALGTVVPYVRWAGDRPPGTVLGLPSAVPLLSAFEPHDPGAPRRLGPAPLGPRGFRAAVWNERWALAAVPGCPR